MSDLRSKSFFLALWCLFKDAGFSFFSAFVFCTILCADNTTALDKLSDISHYQAIPQRFPEAAALHQDLLNQSSKITLLTTIWFAGWNKKDLPDYCKEVPKVLIGGKKEAPFFFDAVRAFLNGTPDPFLFSFLTDETTEKTNQKAINTLKKDFPARFLCEKIERITPDLERTYAAHGNVLKAILDNATGGAPVIASDILRLIALPFLYPESHNVFLESSDPKDEKSSEALTKNIEEMDFRYMDIDTFLHSMRKQTKDAQPFFQWLSSPQWPRTKQETILMGSSYTFSKKPCKNKKTPCRSLTPKCCLKIGSVSNSPLTLQTPSKMAFLDFARTVLEQAEKHSEFYQEMTTLYQEMLSPALLDQEKKSKQLSAEKGYFRNIIQKSGPGFFRNFLQQPQIVTAFQHAPKVTFKDETFAHTWSPTQQEKKSAENDLIALLKKMYPEALWHNTILAQQTTCPTPIKKKLASQPLD